MPPRVALGSNSKAISKHGSRVLTQILSALISFRSKEGVHVDWILLQTAFRYYNRHRKNYFQFVRRSNIISFSTFEELFLNLNDHACLSYFRFLRANVLRLVPIFCSKAGVYLTERNHYHSSPLLTTCLILSLLATPYRWSDRETFFRKHAFQLSEILWEGVYGFVDEHKNLISGPLYASYIANNAEIFSNALQDKPNTIYDCIGFIGGTNIQIARPSDESLQNVLYNGHKRFHALKFQPIVCPDGILLHRYGPVEGKRHDWTLYSRSELDSQQPSTLTVGWKQYFVYGDSGFNSQTYFQVPFQGAALDEDERLCHAAMTTERITVEFLFNYVKFF